MTYLMEGLREGPRLLAQEAANPSAARLRLTGLAPGHFCVDVGCGAGAVTGAMADIVGPSGAVVAFDASAERLALARQHLAGQGNITFVQGELPNTGLPVASFDYAWCQFVLEYLKDPRTSLAELVRLVKPGGRVVVSEIDGFGLAYWPSPPVVEAGREKFLSALASTGFDLFIGRKLFGLFQEVGLVDVKVHLTPFHVTAGAADEQLLVDWMTRFDALAPVMVPAFGGEAAYRTFSQAYLDLLADPQAFKYSVILTVEGKRR
ncbi:MAG: methyltransferase domain-containing protein [Myxococcota bacterium]